MSENLTAVNAVRSAENRAVKLLHEHEARKQAVTAAAMKILRAQGEDVLKSVDIEELNRDRQGIRVNALRAAGFATLYDVLNTPLTKLAGVNGISKEGAGRIHELVEFMANEAASSGALNLSADNKTPETAALVKALCLYLRGEKPGAELESMYNATHESVQAASAAVAPLEGFFSRLFLGSEKKQVAYSALAYFNELEESGYSKHVKELSSQLKNASYCTENEAWSDFEHNAAAYFAALDALGFGSGTGDRSGLSEEMAAEIEQVPLDLTGLRCTLRSYQRFGVQYILNRGSVLLGDEMGLGKTVQAIAAMVALRQSGKTHFMVVCPASVLINWTREIAQHSDLVPIKIHGDIHTAINQWLSEGGVGVTTYESISRFALPAGFTFGMLIADEAHYVKNPSALRTKALIRLRKSAERVLFMTGTPLENTVDEMCFLIEQLQPDIEKKIRTMRFLVNAPKFREEVSPVYFRRTREDVLKELPQLIESEEWCEMTASELNDQMDSAARQDFAAMRQVSWREKDIRKASKALRMMELCGQAKEEGRKVLVFSFYLNTLKQVKDLLGERCFGPVTGAVAPAKRQEIVDEFTKAEPGAVLAAQIQAGGTGLNIQAASVVILCEPQLKPSIENQAISRAYRMGQVRSVLVYRLLCEGSIDERIMELLACKQEIFDNFAEESVSGEEALRQDEAEQAAQAEGISEGEARQLMAQQLQLMAAAQQTGPAPGAQNPFRE